ncbi:hypothetical protein [Caballeronia sp. RCC_10]|uniref:hypothetical protein n=1 Tax=Caballeronia sp. RCC_10 TaxID=3239227 RepID=UPI003525CA5B
MADSFVSDDIFSYQEVKEVQCHPDGRIAACEVSVADRASDGTKTSMALLKTEWVTAFSGHAS